MSERTPPKDPEAALTPAERAELDAASAITPDDLARAQAQWRKDAPPTLRDLLDASPDDPAAA